MPTTLTAELQSLGGQHSAEAKRKRAELPWEKRELERVRGHIARLNRELDECGDPVDMLRITQALSKLYEVAGLPKAGAYRPSPPKSKAQDQVKPVE